MSREFFATCLSSILLCALLFAPAHAAKTDTVILVNGNAVTGELKTLEFGALRYSTDSMGTVTIDWEDIVGVTSKQNLQIELADGTRYFGELLPTDDQFHVRVKTASQEYVFTSQQVVRITPIETSEKLYQRLEGSFSFGIQTEKSNNLTTQNLSADVSYRARRYLVGLRMNSSGTRQAELPASVRQGISTNYQRFRSNRWFTDWFTGWEKNDEQGIARRVSAGAALGRYVTQTNKTQLSITGGVQGSRSDFVGEEEGTTEAEGRFELRYQHRRLLPETSLRFTTTIYPLLKDLSSYRAESDLSLRREVFEDLFLDVTFGYSYNSNPPMGGETSDYVATTSLGYSF